MSQFPDEIFVNDETRIQAYREGIPKEKLNVVGNVDIEQQAESIKKKRLEASEVRKKSVLFISEQLDKNMPEEGDKYIGFNQFDVLDELIQVTKDRCALHIKLHPSEQSSDYEKYARLPDIEFVSSGEMYSKLDRYSVIIGMESILLIELAVLDFTIYSRQPNANRPFIGNDMGWVIDLSAKQLRKLIIEDEAPSPRLLKKPTFDGSLSKTLTRILEIYENRSVHSS